MGKNVTKIARIVLLGLISISIIAGCSGSNGQDSSPRSPEPQNTVTANQTPKTGGVDMAQWPNSPEIIIDSEKSYSALIKTNKGEITVELFAKEAPVTVNNFVFLFFCAWS